jgi:hypothetical protein
MTFDKASDSNTWTVKVYADGTEIGTETYAGVTPGLYIGIPSSMTVEGLDGELATPENSKIPEFSDCYNELSFDDFGMYNGEVVYTDIYSLKGHSDIKSLDGVAISGKVNFNDIESGKIAFGGTDIKRHGGFWLFNAGGHLRLSPQGIEANTIDHHVIWEATWASLKNTDIDLRTTFNKEKATGEWWVGVYVNGQRVGIYNCGTATPGLYLGVTPAVSVEGLGDIVKNSGLDFTLFGYSNHNWKQEMGLQ